jgi:hypothetical protein
MENQDKNRIVEVYTGAYASGKSEISINRALMLKKEDSPVTLVDLDTVEPAYTLRPLKKQLETYGIKIITQESYFGLGETGNVITPAQKNCLMMSNDNIVIDVGYGAGGLDILNLVQGIEEEKNLNIFIVINASKPETCSVDEIVRYVKWSIGQENQSWKKFSGIISNTHFSDQTTAEDVLKGYEITLKAAEILDIPIRAVTVSENLYPEMESLIVKGVSVWTLNRFMPKALW